MATLYDDMTALANGLRVSPPCDCYEPGYGVACQCGNNDDRAEMERWAVDQHVYEQIKEILEKHDPSLLDACA